MSEEPKIPTLVEVKKGLLANTDYKAPTNLDTQDLKQIAHDLLRKGSIRLVEKSPKD